MNGENRKKLEEINERMLEYRNEMHARNARRISIGLRCLFIIPIVFLALMFATDSSKPIFLVLWIISLFILSAYLIYVEYSDYKLLKMAERILDEEIGDYDYLIGQQVEKAETTMNETFDYIDERKAQVAEAIGERRQEIRENIQERRQANLTRLKNRFGQEVEDDEPVSPDANPAPDEE